MVPPKSKAVSGTKSKKKDDDHEDGADEEEAVCGLAAFRKILAYCLHLPFLIRQFLFCLVSRKVIRDMVRKQWRLMVIGFWARTFG